jgi:hypothetical protein
MDVQSTNCLPRRVWLCNCIVDVGGSGSVGGGIVGVSVGLVEVGVNAEVEVRSEYVVCLLGGWLQSCKYGSFTLNGFSEVEKIIGWLFVDL